MSKDKTKQNNRKRSWTLFREDVNYNLKNSSFKKKLIAFSKLLLLLFIMIGIPIILFIFAKDTLLSTEYWADLPNRLSAHKGFAFLILIALQMCQIVICFLPGQPIQYASSYLYGFFWGYVISIVGAIIGTILTFYLADFLGNEALRLVFGEKRVNDYMRKLNSGRAMTIILMIYLIPGIPKDLVSYVAGISDIKLKPFLLVSTVGRTPGIMESLLIGMFLASKNYFGVAITAIVCIAILIFCYKKKDIIMKKLDSYEEAKDEKTKK